MDADRFDAVARSLARPRSRRTLLARAGGTLAALGTAGAGLAAPTTARKKCDPGETRCKKTCCRGGEGCVKGKCVTREGDCAGTAVACDSLTEAVCHCRNGQQGLCNRRMEDYALCCSTAIEGSACEQCRTDRDCRKLGFPRGSYCVRDYGYNCQDCDNSDNSRGTCVVPCGLLV